MLTRCRSLLAVLTTNLEVFIYDPFKNHISGEYKMVSVVHCGSLKAEAGAGALVDGHVTWVQSKPLPLRIPRKRDNEDCPTSTNILWECFSSGSDSFLTCVQAIDWSPQVDSRRVSSRTDLSLLALGNRASQVILLRYAEAPVFPTH